jgi:endonuclease/exonuclease/phosphatase family metal-dependent hydrolase
VIEKVETLFRRLRQKVSRSEMSSRLFRLAPETGAETEPGLLMIQIDGLARGQLEKALARRQMPFLRTLLRREKYALSTHYSGAPSSTPAVQGELFYGVKAAVPAFSFYDRQRKEVDRMFGQEAAMRVEEELAKEGEGLLKGGSAYSNIYTGGASESHFCAPDLGWGRSKTPPSRWRVLAVLLLNSFSFVRMIALIVVEIVLAWVDFFRGMAQGQNPFKELKFVPTRVAICIGLREFIVAAASMDLARGLPIVHLNFIGYDEQAHRRGPSSAFAHWTLLGIDNAIKRLYSAAMRSSKRDYSVWIYSDHGQEETTPFERETGRSLQEVAEEVFGLPEPQVYLGRSERKGIQAERTPLIGVHTRRSRRRGVEPVKPPPSERLVVTSMGPIAHIYDLCETQVEGRERIAEELVARGVPMVLFQDEGANVRVVTFEGTFRLPRDAAAVLGTDHPMLQEAAEDLVRLVKHKLAGEYVAAGWHLGRKTISFPEENGSHAGPGPNEVSGFLLLPAGTPIRAIHPNYYRPLQLREAALHHLKRKPLPPEVTWPTTRGSMDRLRVMTYNVHRCLGVDSRISPERIARVIAQQQPDIVALQEIDVGRARSGFVDQAQAIAELLLMKFHFYPAFEIEDEKYGLAVLSHYPMRLIKTGGLPGLPNKPNLEPRGAQWIGIEYHGREIQLVNTHLGLRGEEKRQQVQAILGEEWLGRLSRDEPLIICGDMNSLPASFVHRQICTRFYDVQSIVREHKPLRTFYGRYPLSRIDHIFVSSHFEADRVDVARTSLTRVASDHLPLSTQLKLREENGVTES